MPAPQRYGRRAVKNLLFLLPLLLGCSSCGQAAMELPPAPPSTFAEMPMLSSSTTATGHSALVAWQCHQADHNPDLIWIECQFQNTSQQPAEACIRVLLSDTKGKEVDRSRVVCSNMMPVGAQYENYAGFENTKHSRRRSLIADKCKEDTSRCTITTVLTNRP
jgi:hypothetical protein